MHRLVALILLGAAASQAASVYAITTNQQFGTLDLDTGSFVQIGPNLPEESSGLVPGPNGTFLSLGFSGTLNSINATTGVTSVLGPTGLGDCSGPGSPCPPNTAFLLTQFQGAYLATDISNNLYRINTSTAAATLIGATGIPPLTAQLEASNPDGSENIADQTLFIAGGKLYATFDAGRIGPDGDITPTIAPSLYQLDSSNFKATPIGPTAFGLFSALEINGLVYAYSAPDGGLVSLDLATGNTTFLRETDPNVGFISGMAPVPEPSLISAVGMGAIGLLLLHRRKEN